MAPQAPKEQVWWAKASPWVHGGPRQLCAGAVDRHRIVQAPRSYARSMPTTHLLYLHGFRSSPLSTKARKMHEAVAKRYPRVLWWCPQLPPSPKSAMQLIEDGIAGWPLASMAVVGSSLGGFYAAAVAERTGCKAALLNPAVDPARDLAAYVGEQTTWQNPEDHFFFRAEFVDELRALDTGGFTDPERYYTLIAKGDEVLDWREMTARFPAAHGTLLEAGDHALSDFEDHEDDLLMFLNLAV